MAEIKHYNIRVHGLVQGVFFRASVRSQAEDLGIRGFAQNEDDGSVYIEAEGNEDVLKTFVAWCQRGPDRARVSHVDVTEGPVKNFSEFKVNRG